MPDNGTSQEDRVNQLLNPTPRTEEAGRGVRVVKRDTDGIRPARNYAQTEQLKLIQTIETLGGGDYGDAVQEIDAMVAFVNGSGQPHATPNTNSSLVAEPEKTLVPSTETPPTLAAEIVPPIVVTPVPTELVEPTTSAVDTDIPVADTTNVVAPIITEPAATPKEEVAPVTLPATAVEQRPNVAVEGKESEQPKKPLAHNARESVDATALTFSGLAKLSVTKAVDSLFLGPVGTKK